jgi:collagenase-like PrtC family protease
MKMESQLSVPYIGEKDYLDRLFERFGGSIDEVYIGLPSGYVGSARPIYYKGLDYEAIARKCHEHGAKLNALLNASCEGLEPYTSEGLSALMSTVKRASTHSPSPIRSTYAR